MGFLRVLRELFRRSTALRQPGRRSAAKGVWLRRPAVEELESRLCLSGNLLVESFNTSSVLAFNGVTGTYQGVFASGGIAGPSGITIGPDNNVYVAARDSNDVVRFDGQTGALLGTFVAPGAGGLLGPHGLEFDTQGNLVVNSGFNGKVLKYDGTTGVFETVIASPGSSPLAFPHGLTVGPDGNLYVGDRNTDSVLRYSGTTGQFLGTFVSSGSGGLSITTDLVFGPDGNLYVNGFNSNAVLRYDGHTGAFLGAFVAAGSGGLSGPQGLVFGPDGNLYVSSMNSNQVLEYDGLSGAFKGVFASGSGLNGPTYLVFQHTDTATAFSAPAPPPSHIGETVSFTATVTPVRSDAVEPTGSVTFDVDGSPQGDVALSHGQATFHTSSLGVGRHTISATYDGDGNFNTSVAGAVTQEVDRFDSTTAVASSGSPSSLGQVVTFTSTVASTTPGGPTPTGTVTFTVDGTAGPALPLSNGQASISTSTLGAGNHTVTAAYSGDATFNPSAPASFTQTVNKLATTVTVTSSANPARSGQATIFTATVSATAPGTGAPSGTVIFIIDGVSQPPVTLTGGTATFTTATLAPGNHSISVVYSGDATFLGSTSPTLTQTVQKQGHHHHHRHPVHHHHHHGEEPDGDRDDRPHLGDPR
jgi:streptogramin lyase